MLLLGALSKITVFSGCLLDPKSECKTAKDHVTWIHQ